MGILDSLTGYMASENEETLRQKKMEESLRMAEEASQQSFLNNFVSQNWKDLPPDQLSGAFNQMGAAYTHTPGISKQFQEMGQTISGAPGPLSSSVATPPGPESSPYAREMYKIDLQLAQPNMSMNEKSRLMGAKEQISRSLSMSEQTAFEKRKTMNEGLDLLRKGGATPNQLLDAEMKGYFGYSAPAEPNLPQVIALDQTSQGRPPVSLRAGRAPGLYYDNSGNPFDANGWLITRTSPSIGNRLVIDDYGAGHIVNTVTGGVQGGSIPGIGHTGTPFPTPAAQQEVIRGAGGSASTVLASGLPGKTKAVVINRMAGGAAPANTPNTPSLPPPPMDFSPALTTDAQKKLETLQPVIQQMNDLETQLEAYIKKNPNQLGNLIGPWLAYNAGLKDENSEMIANMKLISVAAASEYTRTMSRALNTLKQVQAHLPDIHGLGLKSAQLARAQLRNARLQLNRRIEESLRLGGKGISVQGARNELSASPSGGAFIVRAPSGATQSTTRENAIEYLKRPGYSLVQGNLNAK